jgi:hypothetical protein
MSAPPEGEGSDRECARRAEGKNAGCRRLSRQSPSGLYSVAGRGLEGVSRESISRSAVPTGPEGSARARPQVGCGRRALLGLAGGSVSRRQRRNPKPRASSVRPKAASTALLASRTAR